MKINHSNIHILQNNTGSIMTVVWDNVDSDIVIKATEELDFDLVPPLYLIVEFIRNKIKETSAHNNESR
jgi:short-subunit dehydrogenase involved in D-alanine esterification of teichoic acids